MKQPLSNYRVLGLVGQGQFGRVFCAVHRKTGRLVALKDLNRERLPTQGFLRELRLLLSLEHPNIAACQSLEHTATGRRLVLEYCEGGTLRPLLEQGMLAPQEGLALISEVLAGLIHAHGVGIVHCDIKPENILLHICPGGWRVKISDFGIARLSQDLRRNSEGNTGSPAYMAPERFYNQSAASSDLYAVGVMLYELLLGKRPFSGTPLELMVAHINQRPLVPDTLPEPLQDLLTKALQKLPGRRFASAAAMQAAVKATADQLSADPAISIISPELSLSVTTEVKLSQPVTHLAVDSQGLVLAGPRGLNWLPTVGELPTAQCGALAAPLSLPGETLALHWSHRRRLGLVVKPQGVYRFSRRSLAPPNGQGPLAQLISPLPTVSAASFCRGDQRLYPAYGAWSTTQGQAKLHLGPGVNGKNLAMATQPLVKILGLDARHFVLVTNPSPERSQFTIYTRRGLRMGTIPLSTALSQVYLTPTPYRLLALEAHETAALLVIDLKPFRVMRLRLPIWPCLMTATPWGYGVMDVQGTLLFYGRTLSYLGGVTAPPHGTLLQAHGNHTLFLGTWANQAGQLYQIDLTTLGLDILF